jgi:hypothetical protein
MLQSLVHHVPPANEVINSRTNRLARKVATESAVYAPHSVRLDLSTRVRSSRVCIPFVQLGSPAENAAHTLGLAEQANAADAAVVVFPELGLSVDVQKAGFASISDPTDPPPTITVAAGQSLDNVVFRLQKGGAITGRVVDANGEPVAEASIVAMRRLPSPVIAAFPPPCKADS